MNISKFNGISGKIEIVASEIDGVKIEYPYFMPSNLPTLQEIGLDPELFQKTNEANLALGELKGLTKNIGNIRLFANSYMVREAVISSKIEGTHVSMTDVFLEEAGREERKLDVIEVRNFLHALQFGVNELRNGSPIAKDMINHMHYLLLSKVRGAERKVGEFRKCQNWIGPKRKGVLEAAFVPPHAKYVEDLIKYLIDYMNLSDDVSRLLKVGLMHYYFETIHPYEDGNGRLGRTLILLYLIRLKVLSEPILYLSPFFDKNKEEYYDLLMKTRKEGDYLTWLKFFLDGVKEMSEDTAKRMKKIILLYNDYKEKLVEIRATPITYRLLDMLFENPYATIPTMATKLETNYPMVKRGFDYLEENGIIESVTRGRRNKFFRATKILAILERDD